MKVRGELAARCHDALEAATAAIEALVQASDVGR